MSSLLRGFGEQLRVTRSARTTATYAKIAGRFVACFAGQHPPERRDIERFLAAPLQNGTIAAIATRNQVLAALRAFTGYAVQEGIWPADPTTGIPFVQEPRRDPAVLGIAEVHRFFRACSETGSEVAQVRDRAMLALLFTLGLRVHELVGLDTDQVDLASAALVGVRGKGGTVHDLPIEPGTLALLLHWIDRRSEVAKTDEPAIFVSRTGRRLSIRSVERLFERLRSVVGTRKRVTPHTARHSAATIAIMSGGDVSAVGELLRHADLNTTRRYLHLIDTRRRHVARLLGAAIPEEFLASPPQGSETDAALPPSSHAGPTTGANVSSVIGALPASWRTTTPANDVLKNPLDDQDDLGDVGRRHA